jgi:hypothetical protein
MVVSGDTHILQPCVTEAKKTKVLAVLTKIIGEEKDRYHIYHDIHHVFRQA